MKIVLAPNAFKDSMTAAQAAAAMARGVQNAVPDAQLIQVPVADGGEFEVPQGVTVMIDSGAIIKMRRARIGIGSSSSVVDRSAG